MNTQHVIIMGHVFPYGEKAPYVRSGQSLFGALEYDQNRGLVKCHECGKFALRLGSHVAKAHGSVRDYKVRHGFRVSASFKNPAAAHSYFTLRSRLPPPPKESYNKGSRYHRPMSGEQDNMRGRCIAQLAAKIANIARETGMTPKYVDHISIARKLESKGLRWNDLLKTAGVPPNRITDHSRTTVSELIRDFYAANKRVPSDRDFRAPSLPSPGIVRRFFGSIANAIEAAGIARVRTWRDSSIVLEA